MSRPRSGRGNTAAPAKGKAKGKSAPARGGTNRGGGRPGVFVQTAKSDVYTAMLGIAIGAMLVGSLLMVLLLNSYEFKLKAVG